MTGRTSEDTTVVATFASRHDAEIAASILHEHGIDSFIAADDVHPPLQLTEGSRLMVMASQAQEATEILEGDPLPAETATPDVEEADAPQPHGRVVKATSWIYVLAVAAILFALLIGLVIG
jgi:hypothetical protein